MKIIKIKKRIIVIQLNPALYWEFCPYRIGGAAWLYLISKIVHLNLVVLGKD